MCVLCEVTPLLICPWEPLRILYGCARDEQQRAVCDCVAGIGERCHLLRILQCVDVFWYALMFQMILTHLVHKGEQVKRMSASSVMLQVSNQHPRFNVRVKFDGVP